MRWPLILALLATSASLGADSAAPPPLRPATETIERAERNLVDAIQTEDPAFTAFVHRLYRATLFDKLWEPNPPGLVGGEHSAPGAGKGTPDVPPAPAEKKKE